MDSGRTHRSRSPNCCGKPTQRRWKIETRLCSHAIQKLVLQLCRWSWCGKTVEYTVSPRSECCIMFLTNRVNLANPNLTIFHMIDRKKNTPFPFPCPSVQRSRPSPWGQDKVSRALTMLRISTLKRGYVASGVACKNLKFSVSKPFWTNTSVDSRSYRLTFTSNSSNNPL